MFKVTINFEGLLDPQFVFNMYVNPNFRKRWDDRVVRMTFLPQEDAYMFYQQFLFNRPLADRDFIVKCHALPIESGVRVLFYSVKHRDYPEVREVERSKIYFGMYEIKVTDGNTTMLIVQQVDMHFSLLRVQQLVPLFLIDWAARFREECLKSYYLA